MVIIREHGMVQILPSLFEPFDQRVIGSKSQSNHQIVIVDSAVVLQYNVILFRMDLLQTDILWVSMELIDSSLSIPQVVSLLNPLLLIDHSLSILLVDILLQDLHSGVMAMGLLIEVFSEDTSQIAAGNH